MNIQIKNHADSKNIKELKYIFVDALDVDPTFVRYEEEYNYCKSVPGLLETHIELTPFIQDKQLWDDDYWVRLKTDLVKNFSDRRMMHMKEVAQVVLAEKVQRILNERQSAAVSAETVKHSDVSGRQVGEAASPVAGRRNAISKSVQQEHDLEAEKRSIAEENQKAYEAEKADAERIESLQQQTNYSFEQNRYGGNLSKKVLGIAVAALAVAAIVWIFVLR